MLGYSRGNARNLRAFAWALGNINETKSSKHILMERDTWTTREMLITCACPTIPPKSIVGVVEGCGECYLKWVCDAMYCL